MPVPGSISALDVNPNNNSPQGSETVGPNANDYFQAAFAFIKQLATGVGLAPTSDVNMGGKKLTNLGAGDTSSTSTDALNGAQVRGLAYKVGEVRMWHGAVANITTAWGAGWQLADGTNGTADLRGKFVTGASSTGGYNPGDTGGANTVALAVANLPAHNHGVNDPMHVHGAVDSGHSHGVNETPHFHGGGNGRGFLNLSVGGGQHATAAGGGYEDVAVTATAATGLSIAAGAANVSIGAAATGISTQNTGSGTAVENRPPYYALCFVEYTGIGA